MSNNWKMKCLDDCGIMKWCKAGNIYEVKNGRFQTEFGCSAQYNSFDDFVIRNRVYGQFELIKEGKKKMNKFKVGDIVKGNKVSDLNYSITTPNMTKGEVTKVESDGKMEVKVIEHSTIPHEVGNKYMNLSADCFDLVKAQIPSKTLTITTSDSITTLTDGSHTTTINRYYKDKANEQDAVSIVIDKYYTELREIERVEKLPKVGDTVKVIDSERTFSWYDTWIIENKIDIKYAIKWTRGKSPQNGSNYRVIAIHKHLTKNITLALIEGSSNCYIINVEGLEVVK